MKNHHHKNVKMYKNDNNQLEILIGHTLGSHMLTTLTIELI